MLESVVRSLGKVSAKKISQLSSGGSRGAPHGVPTLKVRKGAFDTLNKGCGGLGKVK